MDNFRTIYKILSTLESAMDIEEFDPDQISAERLGISEARWTHIMRMIAENDLAEGIVIEDTSTATFVELGKVRITLQGLEYLSSNSMMAKVHRAMKGIKDSIPGA